MIFMLALSFCVSANHLRDLSKCFLYLLINFKAGMLFFPQSLDSSELPKFYKTLQTWKLLLVTLISGQKVERKQYTQTDI